MCSFGRAEGGGGAYIDVRASRGSVRGRPAPFPHRSRGCRGQRVGLSAEKYMPTRSKRRHRCRLLIGLPISNVRVVRCRLANSPVQRRAVQPTPHAFAILDSCAGLMRKLKIKEGWKPSERIELPASNSTKDKFHRASTVIPSPMQQGERSRSHLARRRCPSTPWFDCISPIISVIESGEGQLLFVHCSQF
jgi:hypothetical protein